MIRRAAIRIFRRLFPASGAARRAVPNQTYQFDYAPRCTWSKPSTVFVVPDANAHYGRRPVGKWTIPSDSGESIVRDYLLHFMEDGTGTYAYWTADSGMIFCGAFRWEPHAAFQVRVKLLGRAEGTDAEQIISYKFTARTNQYDFDILCVRFTRMDSTAVPWWLMPEVEWLDHSPS